MSHLAIANELVIHLSDKEKTIPRGNAAFEPPTPCCDITSALSTSEDLGKVLGVADLSLADLRSLLPRKACGTRQLWLVWSELAHGAMVASGLQCR